MYWFILQVEIRKSYLLEKILVCGTENNFN